MTKPIDQVRALLQSMPAPSPDTPLAERRAALDAFGQSAQTAAGVAIRAAELGRPTLHIGGEGLRGDHAILYLHGGAYTMGSPRSHQAFAARISVAARAEVHVLDYRLAPEHPFPAAIADAAAAFERLLKQAIAARNLAIIGDFAGGGLAQATALTLRDRGVAPVVGLVLLSPGLDLNNNHMSYDAVGARDPILRQADLDRHAAH